jgi:hypothetical protein
MNKLKQSLMSAHEGVVGWTESLMGDLDDDVGLKKYQGNRALLSLICSRLGTLRASCSSLPHWLLVMLVSSSQSVVALEAMNCRAADFSF